MQVIRLFLQIKLLNSEENLSQKTLVQKTTEKQLKATAESCNGDSSNSSNRISSFTPTYHPIDEYSMMSHCHGNAKIGV